MGSTLIEPYIVDTLYVFHNSSKDDFVPWINQRMHSATNGSYRYYLVDHSKRGCSTETLKFDYTEHVPSNIPIVTLQAWRERVLNNNQTIANNEVQRETVPVANRLSNSGLRLQRGAIKVAVASRLCGNSARARARQTRAGHSQIKFSAITG